MPKAERRAQLLMLAREIIERDGIAALTMSALAERAGASKPVVYDHFENSEAVAAELISEYFESLVQFVYPKVSSAENILEYLDIVVDSYFEFQAKNPIPVRQITNGFSSSSLVNEIYLAHQARVIEVYKTLMAQQGASKTVALVAAYAVKEMINAAVFEFASPRNPAAVRRTLKEMVRGAVKALVPEGGPKPITPPVILDDAKGPHRRWPD
jgi:AcrR family transcriptional regulator